MRNQLAKDGFALANGLTGLKFLRDGYERPELKQFLSYLGEVKSYELQSSHYPILCESMNEKLNNYLREVKWLMSAVIIERSPTYIEQAIQATAILSKALEEAEKIFQV